MPVSMWTQAEGNVIFGGFGEDGPGLDLAEVVQDRAQAVLDEHRLPSPDGRPFRT